MLYKQMSFKSRYGRSPPLVFCDPNPGTFHDKMENPGRKILICDKLNLRNSEKAISKPNIEIETVGVRPIA